MIVQIIAFCVVGYAASIAFHYATKGTINKIDKRIAEKAMRTQQEIIGDLTNAENSGNQELIDKYDAELDALHYKIENK